MASNGFLSFLWNGTPPASVTSNSVDTTAVPGWLQDYSKAILAKGQAVANEGYQSYNQPRIAPFSADTNTSFNNVRNNQGIWQPNLSQASSTTAGLTKDYNPSDINSFLSPYLGGVVNQIADLGGRNLRENLLPSVNASFTGLGQWGSSRNQDFTNRAVRDTNESILNQQAQALQQGYDSAENNMNAFRNSQLNAANQLGNLGTQQQAAANLDASTLNAVGAQEEGKTQQSLDTAYSDWTQQRDYPKQQLDWLNNILKGTNVGSTSTTTTTQPAGQSGASPLSQLVGMYSLFKGLGGGMAHGGRVSVSGTRMPRAPGNISRSALTLRRDTTRMPSMPNFHVPAYTSA